MMERALFILLVYTFFSFIHCTSNQSRSPSPDWKSFLNLSPDKSPTEIRASELRTTSQSQARQLSMTKGAIKAREYRSKLTEEKSVEYKQKRRNSSRKSHKAQKILRETDPEKMAEYKKLRLEQSRQYSFLTKAKEIQDPIEREEFLRKHREEENSKRRERYKRNKEQTGKTTKRWDDLKAQKERLKTGTGTQEDLVRMQQMYEKKRKWDKISKERKAAKKKDPL